MPQDTYSRRRRRFPSGSPSIQDPTVAGATIIGRWKVEDVAGVADTKFTTWPNAAAGASPTYDLNVASNGGLTYRVAAAGFGGNLAAAEVAATTDGLYTSFAPAVGSQPFTLVAFGKMANTAGTNGDLMVGAHSVTTKAAILNRVAGTWCAVGQGGSAAGWTGLDTSVFVYTVLFSGANSQLYKNTTQNGSNVNLNTNAWAGTWGIGKQDAETGGLSLWNETLIYSGNVTASLSTIILPYFRTKSGLALL